jgi:hypothetical protein
VTSTEGELPTVNIGNRAGYIAELVREGYSANKILGTLRDLGAGMQRSAGLKLVSQVRESMDKAPGIAGLRGDQLPSADQYGTWQMGRGGQYATNVAVYSIDKDTGASIKSFYTHVTNEPHTPEEAAQAGIDLYTNDDAAQRYGQRVTGALPGMMWQTEAFT